MRRSELNREIRKYIAEHLGVPASELKDTARMVEDLGVKADDSVELLSDLERRYGLDLSGVRWSTYFGYESWQVPAPGFSGVTQPITIAEFCKIVERQWLLG